MGSQRQQCDIRQRRGKGREGYALGLARGVLDAGADPPELVGLVVGGERAAELGVAPVRLLGVGAPGGERVEREELREGRGGSGRGRVCVPRPRALAEAPRHVGDRIARARVPLPPPPRRLGSAI